MLRLMQRTAATTTTRFVRTSRIFFCSAAGDSATGPTSASGAAAKPVKAAQAVAPAAPATTWHTLVIGEIVAFSPHPTADRLNVCQVDIGDRENLVQIVCGAPNVRQGARVPVAKVGTKLALKDPASGDIKLVKIKKSKLRGEVSHGMICSEAELGLADESDGILIFDDDAPIGSLVHDWRAVTSRLVQPSRSSGQCDRDA